MDIVEAGLADCDGLVLAEDVVARTDLPPFDTAAIDGYAVRGPGPWLVVGTVPAHTVPDPLPTDGTAVRIATGAMLPPGTEHLLRTEEAVTGPDGRVDGRPRPRREWRVRGELARAGARLIPAATPITPAVLGAAASAGYDRLRVHRRPRLAIVLLGSELSVSGLSAPGRIRDALGPQLPAWARRLGCETVAVLGPADDTAPAHRAALEQALATGADLIATTGGTMHGPVDHLHSTLADLGAHYLFGSVLSRPGRPLLLVRLPAQAARPAGSQSADSLLAELLPADSQPTDLPPADLPPTEDPSGECVGPLLAGLPGNPQPAVLGLLTLIAPAMAGMTGRPLPDLPTVELAEPIPGRGAETRLALVRLDLDGRAHPVEHDSPAGGPGLAGAAGFAVIGPDTDGRAGERVPMVYLPTVHGERPW